jgi:2-keto-4-pentenoate hydratase/2-oxohepta-3-ene-1,7-dioic acid hydratase in catechol pathway
VKREHRFFPSDAIPEGWGEQRQIGYTAEMVFSVGEIVERISPTVDLEPGDVILTGAPVGVGVVGGTFLRAGTIRNVVVEG